MPDYVDWFVNREKQYQGFQKMLAGSASKRVMLVEDGAALGKTWLVQRMRHHCAQAGIPAMHVDFRDRRAHDFLSLVRVGRDQLGGAAAADGFNALTDAINRFTAVNVSVVAGGSGAGVNIANVTDATVSVAGDLAGGNIVKDNQFFIQADSAVVRGAAEIAITDAFFTCLAPLLARGPVAFLFDTTEELTAEALAWLRDYLLLRLGEGALANAVVVLAGRKLPELGDTLRPLTARTGLERFTLEHVREYIEAKRGISGLDMETIFRTSGGTPGLLAMMADAAAMDKQSDDDWL